MSVFHKFPALPLDSDDLRQDRRDHLSELLDSMVTLQRHDSLVAHLLRRSFADAAALRHRERLGIDLAIADFQDATSAALAACASAEELRVLEEALNRRVRAIEAAAAHAQDLHVKALERVLVSANLPHLRQLQG